MNFATIIAALAAQQAGNTDRLTNLISLLPDPAEYLFLKVLPVRERSDYRATANSLRIVSTMAGMVGMDSPYPQGGAIESNDFSEKTAKLAIATSLNEQQIREIQLMVREARLGDGGTATDPAGILENGLVDLYGKNVVQALDDTGEYLRAQAISTGKLNWTYNGKTLSVDYGIPAEQKKAYTATDGFGGTTSKFWDAVRWGRKTVKSVRAFVVSDDTLEMIIGNDANRISIVSDNESPGKNIRVVTLRRAVRNAEGITVGFDQDARSTVTLLGYRAERQVINPASVTGRSTLQLFPDGVMSVIGNNNSDSFLTNDGSLQNTNNLGFTHIGPTVEGGSRPGRWGRVYTPEGAPWSARAEGVSNELPVIEETSKLALITTPMI